MFRLVRQQITSSWCFILSITREGPRCVLNRPDPARQISEGLGEVKLLTVDQKGYW